MKKLIKSKPILYRLYQNIRYRKDSKIRSSFEKVSKIIKSNNYNSFIFDGVNIWLRVFDNIEFLYVPNKFGGLLGLEKKEGFESLELDFVKNNIKSGDTFIDIGTNFGLYSVFVSKKFKNCDIHSFEPLPETFNIFKENITHNNAMNISANNKGLSFEKGELYFTNDKYAGNHIVMNPTIKSNLTKVEVETLDEYVRRKNLKQIDFIKCDVEGAELLVLQGAKKTIEMFHPIILIEIYNGWTERFGHCATDVIDYLLSFGYMVKMINHNTKEIEDFDISRINEIYDFIFYTGEIKI